MWSLLRKLSLLISIYSQLPIRSLGTSSSEIIECKECGMQLIHMLEHSYFSTDFTTPYSWGLIPLLQIGKAHMMAYLTYLSDLIFMSDIDTEQEKLFRERYAEELRKKKQQDTYHYRGNNELVEERVKVNQQQLKTPGRRGEKIKQEEIDKEIVRRDMIKNKRIPARVLVLESAELYPKEM